jgi:hypothetical protein
MTQLDTDKFGTCKLCHQEHVLRDSHTRAEDGGSSEPKLTDAIWSRGPPK